MSDPTTQATRGNWQKHQEEARTQLMAASEQMTRIAVHMGKPYGSVASDLSWEIVKLTIKIDRRLDAIVEKQKKVEAEKAALIASK